jgi:hypothetical protein
VTVLATVTAPDGRPVELTAERWEHITDGHPEMLGLQADVLRAVDAPDQRREFDEAEHWFYLEGVGPSQWLKVVVVFDGGRGFIATAHARRRFP